jgi:thiamine kinase-like enzyme
MQLDEIIEPLKSYLISFDITICDIAVLCKSTTLVLKINDHLVARIVDINSGTRNDPSWYQKEIEIAKFLTVKNLPIIRLSSEVPKNLFIYKNFVVNFWEYIQIISGEFDYSDIGKCLAKCHRSLKEYANNLDTLGILNETLDILNQNSFFDSVTRTLLISSLEKSIQELSKFGMQAIHGDAHLGNFINTDEGILLSDWEDAFRGPIEWDLASVIWNLKILDNNEKSSDMILSSYGKFNHEALKYSMIGRAAVMSAWYPILYPNPDKQRLEKLERRISWLKEQK